MKPKRRGDVGELERVEKRRGSTTITTKWVKPDKGRQEVFIPTVPLRYRKDHVMFHFDDEARIGISRRELEEEKRRKTEAEKEETRRIQQRKKEQEEMEQQKKKEELKIWIQKEEEEKQRALGRAVLEWHKEMRRWGQEGRQKQELVKNLHEECTCIQPQEELEEQETLVDSLEPQTEDADSALLHSPSNLMAYYVREAARRKPHLFSQTEEEVAARDCLTDSQEEICLGIEQQASTSSTILKGREEKGTMTKETQKDSTDVIYRGMELRPATTSSILAWRKKEGTSARETPGAPQEEIYQRSIFQAGTTSSILAWREGVQQSTQGEGRHHQTRVPGAGLPRTTSCNRVNFSNIRTSLGSRLTLKLGRLVRPRIHTWPPLGQARGARQEQGGGMLR